MNDTQTTTAPPPAMDPVAAAARLQDLRERVFRGEEISAQEYNEVLTSLRAARRASAPTAKKGSKGKTVSVPIEELDKALDSI